MSAMTIFYQQCPVCGRNLRIPTKYFGRQMTCTHCKGEFRAGKDELREAPAVPDHTQLAPGLMSQGAFAQTQLGEV